MLLRLFFLFIIFLSINLNAAKLFLYLNIENNQGFNKEFFLKEISFISTSQKKNKFSLEKKINSTKNFNQIFLKKIKLPSDSYKKIIVKTNKGDIEIPVNFKIKKNDEVKALFFIWDVRGSIKNGKFFPVLFFKQQQIPLRGELLFATSKDEDTLFFIRVDKNQVCAAMKVDGRPVEMALSCVNDKIYVLTNKDKDIKVIEVSSFNQTDIFVLPFIISPVILTKAEDSLIIGDRDNNRILSISSLDGSLKNSVEIGEKISDIVYWQTGERIILGSYNEQMIYFLDSDLKLIKTFKLNCSPSSLYTNKNFLYISETDCNLILKYNLLNDRVEKELRLMNPYRIAEFYSNLYITNYYRKILYIIPNKQLSFSKKIRLSIVPDRIAVCVRRGWIYLSGKNSNKIEVVDLNSEKSHGIINLGAKPYDIKIGRTSGVCK